MSSLSLHYPSSVFEFVQINNSLRGRARAVREIAGDMDPDQWHRSCITPFQRHVQNVVRNVPGKIPTDSCIDSSFAAVIKKLDSGSVSGPAAFELFLKDFAQKFSTVNPAQVLITLANFKCLPTPRSKID